jgi:ABC-type glycerol-3-phosphate transport system permease component
MEREGPPLKKQIHIVFTILFFSFVLLQGLSPVYWHYCSSAKTSQTSSASCCHCQSPIIDLKLQSSTCHCSSAVDQIPMIPSSEMTINNYSEITADSAPQNNTFNIVKTTQIKSIISQQDFGLVLSQSIPDTIVLRL